MVDASRLFSAVIAAATAALLASTGCGTSDGATPGADQLQRGPLPLTFAETIEPMLQQRCQGCHGPGGTAPFPLMTYEDIKGVAQNARYKIERREMPPWGAFDDEDCKVSHPFKDDLRLSDEQIAAFGRWVDEGMPVGDLSKRAPPRDFGARGLVDKTNTFTMATEHELLAGGKDDIRCFPIDPGFTEDAWIAASNVVPGDPRVVHHVIVYVDPKSQSPAKVDATGSYPCFGGPDVKSPSLLLAWAPGVTPTYYGEDAGIKVPKGSKLVLQVHYHPHPTVTARDRTGFEVKVLPGKPSFVSQVLLAGNAKDSKDELLKLVPPSGETFRIPANAPRHVEAMELTIPEEMDGGRLPPHSLLAVGTHMHWAGVDMKVEITRRAPTSEQPAHECLLGTPKYDFNWQRAYSYDLPTDKLPTVEGGDKIRFTCTYDNTTNNKYVRQALSELRLPGPVDIGLGETTLDEMCLGALVVVRRATAID